jgi:anti-sigma-K factor RskA
MDTEALHELTAAYALDALDPAERAEYEEHLATCEHCREELAHLSVVAAELAFAAEPVSPPPGLRDRILEAAQAERPNVVPLRPRWLYPVAAVAAVAACVAVGLGVWDISLHDQLSSANHQALTRVPVTGVHGTLVVSTSGSAALLVSRIAPAPSGKTYEAWILQGKKATAAGLFRAGSGSAFVPIRGKVPDGGRIAVTVEPAGGSPQPTSTPFAVSLPVSL